MLKENIKLSRQSAKKVEAICDFQDSDDCIKQKVLRYNRYMDNLERNGGKYMCISCYRNKHSGRNGSNCKYKRLDDNFFERIDSEEKAYILGFIASDGHISPKNTIGIKIHKKDIDILEKIKLIICNDLKIKYGKRNVVSLIINSKKMSLDVAKILNINRGKKSHSLSKPNIESRFYNSFIRGYFDGDGSIINPNICKTRCPIATISSSSRRLLDWISSIIEIPNSINGISLVWSGNNALDFLHKIYHNSQIHLNRKYELYEIWSQYICGLSGSGVHVQLPKIKINKTRKDAVLPNKIRASDSGYDITIIEKLWTRGNTSLYETGIKVEPDFGWYVIVVPRSSIIKTGYILSNSVGIIDRTYTGTIKVALTKINEASPDIELPCRIAQIIPQPIINFNIVEVETIENTGRAEGGFGSTDTPEKNIEKYVEKLLDNQEIYYKMAECSPKGSEEILNSSIIGMYNIVEQEDIGTSERGEKGFGSSGV